MAIFRNRVEELREDVFHLRNESHNDSVWIAYNRVLVKIDNILSDNNADDNFGNPKMH